MYNAQCFNNMKNFKFIALTNQAHYLVGAEMLTCKLAESTAVVRSAYLFVAYSLIGSSSLGLSCNNNKKSHFLLCISTKFSDLS